MTLERIWFDRVRRTSMEDLGHGIMQVTPDVHLPCFLGKINIKPFLISLQNGTLPLQILQYRQEGGASCRPTVRKPAPHPADSHLRAAQKKGEHLKFEVGWMRDFHVRKQGRHGRRRELQRLGKLLLPF